MRASRLLLSGAVVAVLAMACVQALDVVQGTVVSMDETTMQIVLKDEMAPHGELRISLQGAEVGANPEVGDVVRVAYRKGENGLVATRVMNLTKQAELAGTGKATH